MWIMKILWINNQMAFDTSLGAWLLHYNIEIPNYLMNKLENLQFFSITDSLLHGISIIETEIENTQWGGEQCWILNNHKYQIMFNEMGFLFKFWTAAKS